MRIRPAPPPDVWGGHLKPVGHKPGWQLREHLGTWRRVRRYAVPPSMVERATACRLADDWIGACAAARIAVEPDLLGLAGRAGIGSDVRDDLRHLAPDLLRWHLPRQVGGRAAPQGRGELVLACYPTVRGADPMILSVRLPADPTRVPVLGLKYRVGTGWRLALAREYWDVRRVDGLRMLCGDAERTAFFRPDGTPTGPPEVLPAAGTPGSAARLEWATSRWDAGDIAGALAAYGLAVTDPDPGWADLPLAVHRLAHAVAATGVGATGTVDLPSGYGRPAIEVAIEAERMCVRPGSYDRPHGRVWVDRLLWTRLPDWDLLRHGLITRQELHPLVQSALFPAAPVQYQPTRFQATPVRVRCRGSWHEALVADGTLRLSAHTPEELRREEILHRFGAALEGCAAIRVAWLSGRQVSRGLQAQRQHLFDLAFHGDAEGVRALLEAGFDPHARIEGGSTLLHYLAYVDHRDLLPYLLAAGLDLGAVDLHGRTPLRVALDFGADALAEDLRRAGA